MFIPILIGVIFLIIIIVSFIAVRKRNNKDIGD